MLGHDDILGQIRRLKAEGKLRNRDLQDLLNLPSSRVSEILGGRRRLTADEAALVQERYGLEGSADPSADPDRELNAILPLLVDRAGLDEARADLFQRVLRASLQSLRAANPSDERLREQAELLVQALWQSLPRQDPQQ